MQKSPPSAPAGCCVTPASRDHLRQWCRHEQEIAHLRAEIDRLRALVLTAVDVLLRAKRDDEAVRLRRGLDRR